jgi:signal transduction histidine kinase
MENKTSLEQFLAKTTNFLAETERNLSKLAQTALLNYEQAHSDADSSHLQQISRYLVRLSERSQALSLYLQNGLDKPLSADDDNYWPLVRVLQSQEEEQTQLARELEDHIGQLLANSVFELASCRHLLGHDEKAVSTGLDALQVELEQGLADLRWFIGGLEPTTILGNFGLGGGIRRYLEKFKNRTKLEIDLRIKANFGRLPSIIEVAVFRVIQEALSNVEQHAEATRVEVIISEEKNTKLEFSISDNGRGLMLDDVGRSRKNLGLARMVDYAELLKGTLKMFSQPNQGTKVVLSIPYPKL